MYPPDTHIINVHSYLEEIVHSYFKINTQITFQRKNHLIGRFSTKREAIKARKEAEYIYFDKYRKS